MSTRKDTARERPDVDDRPCWQCNSGGYVVPANRIKRRGGSPSLIKCSVCDGTGRIEAANDAKRGRGLDGSGRA